MMAATRRAAIGAILAGPLVSTSAIGGDLHPDAGLLDLGRRHAETQTAVRLAVERWEVLTAATAFPKAPEALFLHPGDHALGLAAYACKRDDGRMWYAPVPVGAVRRYLRRRQWRWQSRPVRAEDNLPEDAFEIVGRVPWPEAQARADAIVAAWDAWEAERDRIREESGLQAAGDEWNRLDDAVGEIEAEIWAATARTLDGLLVKARLAQRDFDEENEPPPELVAGLIRDLLALGGASC